MREEEEVLVLQDKAEDAQSISILVEQCIIFSVSISHAFFEIH